MLGPKLEYFKERGDAIFRLCDITTTLQFEHIIYQTRTRKCTDPNDRVYAVLNLLQSKDGLVINTDYAKMTCQAYQDVVVRSIGYLERLNILTSCEIRQKPLEMPTWVPDWSVARRAKPVPWGRAARESIAEAQYIERGVLKVYGVMSALIRQVESVQFAGDSR